SGLGLFVIGGSVRSRRVAVSSGDRGDAASACGASASFGAASVDQRRLTVALLGLLADHELLALPRAFLRVDSVAGTPSHDGSFRVSLGQGLREHVHAASLAALLRLLDLHLLRLLVEPSGEATAVVAP